MADFAFSVLGKLASSALHEINRSKDEINRLKEAVSTIEPLVLAVENMQTNNEALRIWRTKIEEVIHDVMDLLYEIQRRRRGIAGCSLVFRFRIGHRIKKIEERIDEICRAMRDTFSLEVHALEVIGPADEDPEIKKKRERVIEMVAKIDKLNLNATYSIFRASEVIGLDEDRAKQIVYVVACIVAVCMDPFFLYIPFLNHAKMCLGMNTELWLVAVVVRTVADFFTAQILFNMSIKSILLMCVKYLALVPIPQILFSEKFILKTLRGYTFWNLSLFYQYGIRLVLIFLACEQLKTRVSIRTLVWFNAPVYLFLYLIVSHVIGASWYYLSIKRQLSCWHHVCKIDTGCIFHCDGTTTSTLNSTLYNQFCPINPPNAAVFDYGIYLDALQSRIVEEKGVLKKFLRCFFWGLRNLSSFASNLQTSTNGGETFFAIIISVVALLLLIYIIGNIQRYAELASARSEKIEDKMEIIKPKIKPLVKSYNLSQFAELWIAHIIKKALENDNNSFNFKRLDISPLPKDDTIKESLLQDLRILETSILNPMVDIQGNAEKWLSDNKISYDQNIILFYMKCRLKDNQDVNLKSILSVLPYKHQWMTKKDLCFDTLKKVPGLQNIDEEWFRSISSKLEPVIYPKESYIFREGEPLEFIIFITNGILWNYTTSTDAGGRVCVSINSLEKGDFFGEELVQWKLDKIRELNSDRIPLSCIPISTANVKSHTQVEALVLMINDLALSSDFPVATSILWRIDSSRIANSAAERVDSSSRTEEGASVQREIAEV